MSEKLDRFVNLMKGIFELDKSDLDFGIYRIMNIRKAEIEKFLSEGLPQKIMETLAPFANDTSKIEKRIAEIEAKCEDVGMEVSESKMADEYAELKSKLVSGVDMSALEADVYSALYNFFNRYYDEGDFISKRRYKEGVYAIPYEGEEVKLYWANQDQYYIKTSENFKDYTFKVEDYTIHFRIVDATTEQNNNKENDNSKRQFMLYVENEEFPEIKTFEHNSETKEIIIRFVYDIPEDKKRKYKEENYKAVHDYIYNNRVPVWNELLRPIPAGKGKETTLLEKHMNAYVAKNTFDYFIHKDLKGFLRRELDFYIKNEIMHLDDLDTTSEERVETYLAKVRAVKRVGHIIIDFLAQIENFQKKLWLKKKFVIETNWCITLDRIDESFYPEIIANKIQIQEWIDMYAINENASFSVDFLKENQNLIVDTKHFSEDFKERLIATIDNLDEQTGGLLINSDNFQTLNLLQNRYKNKIQCCYIDPPYNTVYSEIAYKNNYKHSSWLTLLNNTLSIIQDFWTFDFSFGIAIDDYEFVNISQLLDMCFPMLERSNVIVNHHPQGAGGRLSRTHEYYILLSNSSSPAYLGEPVENYQEDRSFMRSGTGENNYRYARWKSFYALLFDPKTKKIIDVEDPVPLGEEYPVETTSEGYIRIYPINSKGEERVWRSSYLTGRERAKNGELFVSERGAVYQSIDHEAKRETLFSNWTDSKFNAGTKGANLLKDLGLSGIFDYPKSICTLETGLWGQTFGRDNGIILDYFAGSGTTGHAVINMNRKFGGNRKYILVEMGEYFNTVTLPRMKKVVYSANWKDGKPTSRDTGVSHIMKYMKLESYEDALSNITLDNEKHGLSSILGEGYLINYMLDIESEGSLLNLDAFKSPFDYRLKVNENNETKEKNIDVVETFNYLIGLTVRISGAVTYFDAFPDRNGEYEGAVRLSESRNGEYGFKQIDGTLPDGRKALVIWRTISDDILESNAVLDAYFAENIHVSEYDIIYVNGDTNLQNEVKMIETEFRKRMFEEE